MKKANLQKFGIVALACGIIVGTASIPDAMAKKRGKSGLPDGPGNPIAQTYKELQELQEDLEELEAVVEDLKPKANLLWINHLDLVPGDVDVLTSYNSTTSGVGSGLSGLIIASTTAGEVSTSGGNKVVEKGLQVPPGYKIAGVRVCYEASNAGTYISQIRLSQLQDPPSVATVILDDPTDLTDIGPVCANSAATSVDPTNGAVRLDLRVNFAAPSGLGTDIIVLRGLGLYLEPAN